MKIIKWIRTEPVAIAGVIQAALGTAALFGVPITSEQVGGVMALTAALLALVVRQAVMPTINGGIPGLNLDKED